MKTMLFSWMERGKGIENLHSSYDLDEILYRVSAIIRLCICGFRENWLENNLYIIL
jgi:hypothetical protein